MIEINKHTICKKVKKTIASTAKYNKETILKIHKILHIMTSKYNII